ncbi:MAG: hypothetical protein J5802_10790 [Butyrivibrio sp.]|nr:hypothetical protein [Butyrivibrio sp.]
MRRIKSNPIFIIGCIIAFLVTFVFTKNLIGLTGSFEMMGTEGRMYFVSIAIMAFFTIFVPLYTNMEFRYGVIRNKLVAGYSQKEVYLSHLLGHFTALAIMTAVYIVAGILGGARDFGKLFGPCVIYIISICGYIAVMMLISFRITKMVIVSIFAFLVLNFNYSAIMFGNFLISFVLKGIANKIGIWIYNMSPFGQWMVWFYKMAISPEDFTNPGVPAQILISVGTTLIMMFLATAGINKRNLK